MFSKEFWKGAAERAIKTAAQFALFPLGVDVLSPSGVEITASLAQQVGVAAAFGAVASLLTSIASSRIGEKGTPSLTSAETVVREDNIPWDDVPVETHETNEL